MFQSDLSGKFSNSIHKIFPLSMDNFRDIIQVSFGLLVLTPNLIDLLVLWFKFFLFAAVILTKIHFYVLFSLQLLLEKELLPTTLF